MGEAALEQLRDIALFGALSDETLKTLVAHARRVELGDGEYFFREDDQAHSMFVVERGVVEVSRHWQGRDYPLAQLHAGDCFGEMALIEAAPRSASVRAHGRCVALELEAGAILGLSQHDLEQFVLLYMNLAREVSRRLHKADERLFELLVANQGRDTEGDRRAPSWSAHRRDG